jgi:formylglycine-generating enzyme required for sulfatase activity
MAGNVAEWVSSLNAKYPYNANDGRENLNATGDRILRGGSWNNIGMLVRSTDRAWNAPLETAFDYGFRCAKDANP